VFAVDEVDETALTSWGWMTTPIEISQNFT